MTFKDPDTGNPIPLDRDLEKRYGEEWSAWNAKECVHERTELRQGFNAGNAPIIRQQCLGNV